VASSPIQYWDQFLTPLVSALADRSARPCLTGVVGSTSGFTLTLLAQRLKNRSLVIVGESDEAASQLFDDLEFFHTLLGLPTDQLVFFPEWESLPYETAPPQVTLVARRMLALQRLSQKARTLLVTSAQALTQRVLPKAVFLDAIARVKPGDTLEREALVSRLLRLGYRQASVVEIPGEFSIRGGIVDIYSTAYSDPLRIEFLGDTVESIRCFDQATQKSTAKRDHAWLLPARELIYAAGRPEGLAPLPPDGEWRSPDVYGEMPMLLDYLDEAPLLVLDQPESLAAKAREFRDEVDSAYLRREGETTAEPYPQPARLLVPWEEVLQQARAWPWLALAPLASPDATWWPAVESPARTPNSAGLALRGTPFADTLKILDQLRSNGLVILVARSRGQADRLLALFAEHDVPATAWKPPNWTTGSPLRQPLFIVQGEVSAGFVVPDGCVSVITEEDLFAKAARHRTAPASKTATFLTSLDDLEVGDYVVHIQHGVARYQGLRRLSVQDFDSDYLILEFAGADKLYVPLDRLNHVQRYMGADGHALRLDRLGGTSWERTTAKVKKGVEEMARELVALYANRELVSRAGYAGDSTLSREFEAAFEYEETADQLRAIEDIKRDLESPKPMDRLVCGDVGYGKTEVAMRAAFKAVEDNRQVAVLVPTTLLAQQHYDNFSQRFAPFPARVAMLSRFQSTKEAKAILRDLADGKIDVMIGTHRLLQKGVEFRNLGLVIIDEEQWFGVRHKERLKQLRTQVDVLTLTATPIPRTLQMAMAGVRDLSVIETPPLNRLSIRTQVVRFGAKSIREAIARELGRGGQVFFVHNRVQTMERMGAWLRDLIPEARIVMAHGQMDERLLESVMLKFLRREADVLLCSSIIQSGLDVSNANTIVVHRADMFGLAQLYQLRGRVGRSGQQAYAYFLTPEEEGELTPDAQKRLVAIQQFTDLGAGFRIAAADMEIRGAGNLLGKEQSGHIAAVGLNLYLQMVEQAVQQLKGAVVEEEPDPTLHVNVSAYVPDEYVADSHQRLSLYKRLSSTRQVGELALLHGEMQDRYGPPPEPVERLFEVMEIRTLAKGLRLASVEVAKGSAVITFSGSSGALETGMRRVIDRYQRRFRLVSPTSFELQMPPGGWSAVFPELSAALKTLAVCDTKNASVERAS
jgi:transcription-repair coupling factor (superfamily II helicase)